MAEDARRAEMALRDRVAGAVRAGRELDPPPG